MTVLLTAVCPTGLTAQASNDFLDRLVGSWTLTGTMGATQLRQRVDARWTLQGLFLQMHVIHEGPTSPGEARYEAIYLLSHDDRTGQYLMHLFDTFGPAYSRTVGVGTRRDESVEFLFDYPSGLFSNTFRWDAASGGWEMVLRQRQASGEWKVFATKTLSRSR